jgi:hypothetical protein
MEVPWFYRILTVYLSLFCVPQASVFWQYFLFDISPFLSSRFLVVHGLTILFLLGVGPCVIPLHFGSKALGIWFCRFFLHGLTVITDAFLAPLTDFKFQFCP